MGKLEQNKLEKRNRLENAAYQLFTTKGFQNTSVNDIVTLANVAKGTFYLYYHDKNDLLNRLIINSCAHILTNAMLHARSTCEDIIERLIIITDYVISCLEKDTALFSIINTSFSWSHVMNEVTNSEGSQLQMLFNEYSKSLKTLGYSQEEATKLLFIIVELIGTVSYSCITQQFPMSIDELRPTLFKAVRKILS
ncbi:MAG: TetR/AcrR family transcriptional regulator [Oscillospiraceae bacterium]|nr:TetR/AcrR family transcriptional regulator [Oscillospiraceae bacterium]